MAVNQKYHQNIIKDCDTLNNYHKCPKNETFCFHKAVIHLKGAENGWPIWLYSPSNSISLIQATITCGGHDHNLGYIHVYVSETSSIWLQALKQHILEL